MIATAQHVRQLPTPTKPEVESGVNVILQCAPFRPDATPDELMSHSGEVFAVRYDVRPGGNAVLSYLDVFAPDDADLAGILSRADYRTTADREDSIIVFHATDAVRRRGLEEAEFDRLRAAIIEVSSDPGRFPATAPRPFRIWIDRFGDKIRFVLDAEDEARAGVEADAVSVQVTQDVLDDWIVTQPTSILDHIAPAVCGMSQERLFAEGGVEFRWRGSDEVAHAWPPR